MCHLLLSRKFHFHPSCFISIDLYSFYVIFALFGELDWIAYIPELGSKILFSLTFSQTIHAWRHRMVQIWRFLIFKIVWTLHKTHTMLLVTHPLNFLQYKTLWSCLLCILLPMYLKTVQEYNLKQDRKNHVLVNQYTIHHNLMIMLLLMVCKEHSRLQIHELAIFCHDFTHFVLCNKISYYF